MDGPVDASGSCGTLRHPIAVDGVHHLGSTRDGALGPSRWDVGSAPDRLRPVYSTS